MFSRIKEIFSFGKAELFNPMSVEERVKRSMAPILRIPSNLIKDDQRLGSYAEEVRVVLTLSFGLDFHTSAEMTVEEVIQQIRGFEGYRSR
jgi:hypothetical protein